MLLLGLGTGLHYLKRRHKTIWWDTDYVCAAREAFSSHLLLLALIVN